MYITSSPNPDTRETAGALLLSPIPPPRDHPPHHYLRGSTTSFPSSTPPSMPSASPLPTSIVSTTPRAQAWAPSFRSPPSPSASSPNSDASPSSAPRQSLWGRGVRGVGEQDRGGHRKPILGSSPVANRRARASSPMRPPTTTFVTSFPSSTPPSMSPTSPQSTASATPRAPIWAPPSKSPPRRPHPLPYQPLLGTAQRTPIPTAWQQAAHSSTVPPKTNSRYSDNPVQPKFRLFDTGS